MATAFDVMKRRLVRMDVNPLDKTTIVSIAPFDIKETILTIQPGHFFIPRGTLENPSLTVIGPSSWWKEEIESGQFLEVPVASVNIARDLIQDYIGAINGVTMGVAQPGIFHIAGTITLEQVKKDYKQILERMEVFQNAWFRELIRQADGLWARSNQNPLSIDDQARLAAKSLNIDKPWIKDFQTVQNIPCVACGNLRNPKFPVCQSCNRIVDKELAIKLGVLDASTLIEKK